jgi:hypothetical protein
MGRFKIVQNWEKGICCFIGKQQKQRKKTTEKSFEKISLHLLN